MPILFRYILAALVALLLAHATFAQRVFNLQQCIDMAIENSIVIDKAELVLQDRELDMQGLRHDRLPNINGFTNIYNNFGQSQDIFGNNARNDNFNGTLGVSSVYSILNNGRIRNSIQKTKREREAGEQDLALLKRETTLKTIQAFLHVLLKKEICKSVDTVFWFAKNQLQKVQASKDLGAASLTVLYEAKANYEREQEKNRQAHYAIDKAMLELKQLINIDRDQDFNIVSEVQDLSILSTPSYKSEDLYTALLAQHPVLKKYAFLKEALEFEQKAIKSQLYPTVDANLTLGSFYFNNLTSGFGKTPLFNQLQNNFSQQIGLSINLPIFNKHAVKIAVQKNKIQQAEQAKAVEYEKLIILQDLENRMLDLSNYQEQLKLATTVLESAKKAFELSYKSYDAGRISIYDLNTSRSNLFMAESELIQTKYNLLFTHVVVHYLTTGNTEL
ncbi:TolC family protein [Sphingobacterium suaedae]|uniref:TolC family protein n=1 Tax=Sphingobacterium suaedae TaxID=1686402 RepID=A0ABW5KHS7_9SPHI